MVIIDITGDLEKREQVSEIKQDFEELLLNTERLFELYDQGELSHGELARRIHENAHFLVSTANAIDDKR